MSNILKDIFTTPDRTHNGRIYPESVFLNEIKRMRPKMRMYKIKRLFNEE